MIRGNEKVPEESLSLKTIRGVKATLVGTVGGALLQMFILIVLARLLTPQDYGAYAVALIIVQPLQTAVLSTTERALVIQGEVPEESMSSVLGITFWMMVAIAIVIGLSGLLVAKWFDNVTGATLAACAPILPVAALAMTARAHLRRQMAFGKLVVTDLSSQILGVGGVSILCAMMGFGPFSLVLGSLVQVSVQALGYRSGAIRGTGMNTNFAAARPTLKMAYLLGRISLLEIIQGQVPSIFIGAILGTAQLGLFSRAYSLVQVPIELLTTAILKVLYSSFVTVREDKEKFVRALYRLLECVIVIIFPIGIGMAIAAPQLVGTILGDRWHETEPLIAWLALGSALTMTGTLFASAVEAALHLNAKFYGQLLSLLVSSVLFAVLTRYGLVAASIAFAAAWILYFFVQACLAKVLLHLSLSKLLSSFAPGVVGGAVIGVYVLAVQSALHTLSPVMLLAIEIVGCGVLLACVVAFLFPRLFRELLSYSGLDSFVPGP
jgi:lipopolysaccharide exporter